MLVELHLRWFMAVTVDATYTNGVFVPEQSPGLPEHEKVRLTVEPINAHGRSDDVVCSRRSHRIKINPTLAREIADAAEFSPDGA